MDKYDNIIKECRDLVESLPPGATVPSVRRLMKRFGVSQLVITQAMNEMKKAGIPLWESFLNNDSYDAELREKLRTDYYEVNFADVLN